MGLDFESNESNHRIRAHHRTDLGSTKKNFKTKRRDDDFDFDDDDDKSIMETKKPATAKSQKKIFFSFVHENQLQKW